MKRTTKITVADSDSRVEVIIRINTFNSKAEAEMMLDSLGDGIVHALRGTRYLYAPMSRIKIGKS